MKKIITLLSLVLVVSFAMAQHSQRVAIIEEFTQASCSPCAAANPGFNALLHADPNPTKILPIKYQVWWPGFDPMYLQNQADVNTRVALYAVSGVPDAVMDGNVWHGNPNLASTTNPFSQAKIDAEYAVPAYFHMSLTHTISAAFDSVFVTCIITADSAMSGTFVAQIALLEKTIHFATAPGSNGETDFYEVMKKMLPDASGTALASTWAAGDDDTLHFAVPIPNWYYDITQLEAIASVQDMANKNIKQGTISAPIALTGDANLDAAISAIVVPGFSCSVPITLACTLKNAKTTVLTAATINYQVDNGPVSTQAWTGSLAAAATANISLPDLTTLSGGSHTVKIWVSNPNGATDFYPVNNALSKSFVLTTALFNLPVAEGFQGTAFPATDWFIINPDAGITWAKKTACGGFGLSTSCSWMYFYNYGAANQLDYLHVPAVDLSTATAATLTFNHAYCSYAGEADGLKVEVSTDCGATWVTVFNKAGTALATAANNTASFTPTATQWAWDAVDLTQFAGQQKVYVRFTSVNKYGNNLYLDDINITTAVGINEPSLSQDAINVYPNPFNTSASVDLSLAKTSKVTVSLVNLIGQTVYNDDLGLLGAGKNSITIDGANLQAGMYYMHLNVNGQDYTRKVAVEK